MALNVHVIEANSSPFRVPDALGQHWISTTTKEMWVSVGTLNISDWVLVQVTTNPTYNFPILAGQSQNLHTIPYIDLACVDYTVNISDSANDAYKSVKLYAAKKSAGEVESSVYAILGDYLDVELNFIVVGSDAVLEAVNNTAFPITVKIKPSII